MSIHLLVAAFVGALFASVLEGQVVANPRVDPQVAASLSIPKDVADDQLVDGILNKAAHLNVKNVLLVDALTELGAMSGVPLLFSPTLLPRIEVTCRCGNKTVAQALAHLLEGTRFAAFRRGTQVMISRPVPGAVVAVERDGDRRAGDRPKPLADLPDVQRIEAKAPPSEDGVISGRVVDAKTGQPLSTVQVYLQGLGVGALTQQNGKFTLRNVPDGSHVVVMERIGYRGESRPVTKADRPVTLQDLELTEEALALDEIVVTGTPGGTQRRAIGNVVGRVAAAEITRMAPVTNMQDLLGAREPGLVFHRSSGNLGTGSSMRIRGVSSLSLGQQPLIYVDGIRIDNQSLAGPNIRDGRQVSVLDDFSPEEIESIEIIKGAAAATLYGTEASAGVVQIITKKGMTGAPQFDLSVRQGATWLMDPRGRLSETYSTIPETGEIVSFSIWDQEEAAGRQFFGTGHLQSYSLSMRGGTDAVRYYMSADWDDNEGIVDYNWQEQMNARANISLLPSSTVSMDLSAGYVSGLTSFMQQRTGWGVWEQAMWSNPRGRDRTLRGFLRARPEEIANVEAFRDAQRFTGSLTLNYTPFEWLTQRAIVGIDAADEENKILFPRHPDGSNHEFGGRSLGDIELERPKGRYTTMDYGISASYALNDDVGFKTSYGAQYYHRRHETMFGRGLVFPAPAIRSLEGAAGTTAGHEYEENKSFGMYLQQDLTYRDRVYLTAAARGDDNSAFGAEFEAAIYPKFSATWVVSDEPFWRFGNVINSLRLRSAWGQAGRQPSTFAAVTVYSPEVGPAGSPAATPGVLGNPDLGPEVTTEIEVGFDAALLDDRLSTQFTYYSQKVTDALLSVPVSPTMGFPGSQEVNLGRLSNWGWELTTDGQLLRGERFGMNLGATLAYNRNRIDDMGGRPPTSTAREGFPYPAIFLREIVDAEFANPNASPLDRRVEQSTLRCDGGTGRDGREAGGAPVPCAQAPEVFVGTATAPWEMGLNADVTVFRNLRFHALAEGRFGDHLFFNCDISCRSINFGTSRAANYRDDPYFVAVYDGLVGGNPHDSRHTGWFDPSFIKLREVGATYTLPDALLSRFGASRSTINVAGRNLWTIWVKQKDVSGTPVPDPEARNAESLTNTNSNIPPLASFLVTVRMSF